MGIWVWIALARSPAIHALADRVLEGLPLSNAEPRPNPTRRSLFAVWRWPTEFLIGLVIWLAFLALAFWFPILVSWMRPAPRFAPPLVALPYAGGSTTGTSSPSSGN